jgi:arylsulfatase A-like enzyme
MHPAPQSSGIPILIRDPDHLAGRRCDTMVELTDITATILDEAGLDPAEALGKDWPLYHRIIPGRSLLPVVRGETDRIRDAAFSEHASDWRAVETEDWQFTQYLPPPAPGSYLESLFHKRSDPHCLVDLSGDPSLAAAADQLRARLHYILDTTPYAQTGWAPIVDWSER